MFVVVTLADTGWRWGTWGAGHSSASDRAQYTRLVWPQQLTSNQAPSFSLSEQNLKYFHPLCLSGLWNAALQGVWGGWGCYNVTSWHDPEREMTDKHGYMTAHMMSQYTHTHTPYLRHTSADQPARTTFLLLLLLLFSLLMFYFITHFILLTQMPLPQSGSDWLRCYTVHYWNNYHQHYIFNHICTCIYVVIVCNVIYCRVSTYYIHICVTVQL